MQINSNTLNATAQQYAKSNMQSNSKANNNIDNIKEEAISLDIQNSNQGISSSDKEAVRARIEEISQQLDIDYAKETENFSKNNVNFFEGSLLTTQSSNINESAIGLLSE